MIAECDGVAIKKPVLKPSGTRQRGHEHSQSGIQSRLLAFLETNASLRGLKV
jgi:hypothetical protein